MEAAVPSPQLTVAPNASLAGAVQAKVTVTLVEICAAVGAFKVQVGGAATTTDAGDTVTGSAAVVSVAVTLIE
jgi:hypothetical protein